MGNVNVLWGRIKTSLRTNVQAVVLVSLPFLFLEAATENGAGIQVQIQVLLDALVRILR